MAALVGQALFVAAWLLAGALEPGYSHDKQEVSELMAENAHYRWIVSVGVVALGASFGALGFALRAALPPGRWSVLPPALFIAIGLGITLEAALPLDCMPGADQVCRDQEQAWELSWVHYAHGFDGLGAILMIGATLLPWRSLSTRCLGARSLPWTAVSAGAGVRSDRPLPRSPATQPVLPGAR